MLPDLITRRLGQLLASSLPFWLAACGAQRLSPEAERGREVYEANCTACHNPDPAKAGPMGPAIAGSSRELVAARVVEGTYPPGYTPKRTTTAMPPMPELKDDVDALAAYLK